MTTELSEYLKQNNRLLLSLLIRNQHCCPPYAHENNMETGISYETCLETPETKIKHIKQQTHGDKIKEDLLCYLARVWHLELKTIKSDFLSGKLVLVNYKKENGEGTDLKDILAQLADGCLIYQKFDFIMGRPALLGYISQECLREIFMADNRRKIDKTNVYFTCRIDDFEWYCNQTTIQRTAREFPSIIAQLKIKYNRMFEEEKNKLYEQNVVGTIECDCHLVNFQHANTKEARRQKSQIIVDARQLLSEGKLYYEVAKKVNIKPDTLQKWVCIAQAKEMLATGNSLEQISAETDVSVKKLATWLKMKDGDTCSTK